MVVVKFSTLLFLLSVLVGCQSSSHQANLGNDAEPVLSEQLNWRSAKFNLLEVISPEQIFYLSDAQQQHFLDYYHDPANAVQPGHKRLFNYLENILDGFDYRGETYPANLALQKHTGNCLSLAIVTTALARLVELDVSYQRVNTAPIYQRFHNVMTLSSHVRTHVYAPEVPLKKNQILLLRSKLVIDYFPDRSDVKGEFISQQDFISMFYQNLAGDALVEKNYDLAYSLLNRAMELHPKQPETINTIAVLHKEVGNPLIAEKLYQFALEQTTGSVNVLGNYALLLEQQQRLDELAVIEQKLTHIQDDNPYRWYDIANRQYNKQKYAIALKYFKRSVEVAPYLHEGYFGLAKTYFKIGLEEQAALSMQKAAELAFTPADEYLYQAKLRVLSAGAE